MIEEIEIFKSFSPVVALIIIMTYIGKWIIQKSFEQVEKANASLQENQIRFQKFMEDTFNKNTDALTKLTASIDRHMQTKEEALDMLKQKDETINELFEMVKKRYND